MLIAEAQWVAERLARFGLGPARTVVDVASSTEEYRRLRQPYVDYLVFRPLRQAGVPIIHLDAKHDPGVDLVADIAAETLTPSLEAIGDVVVCCNLLEHVRERSRVLGNLRTLTKPGGHVVITVPHRYPPHADPIDTGYRPSPPELADEVARVLSVRDASLIESAPASLSVPDGPSTRIAYYVLRTILARGARGRMPRLCLVSAVVAQRT